jgi:DNA polymerase (family 10)
MYFTGSKAHNIALRGLANDRGWKLNEYGLFDGQRRIAGATEEEIYRKLAGDARGSWRDRACQSREAP